MIRFQVRNNSKKSILNKTENATHILAKKIALTLCFRNKMKLHMKISIFGFHLLETHV